MRATIPVLVLAAVLLAGCGGGGSSNGEATKPAKQVLADAAKAATSASSLHASGKIDSGGSTILLNLWLVKDKGATGSMTTGGGKFDLIRIGNAVYIRGSAAFLEKYAGPYARTLRGKWLKTTATSGQLRSLTPLTSPAALFGAIAHNHGTLSNDGVTTYKGRKVAEIRDSSDNSKLYVAATGNAYPLAIVGGKRGQSGAIAFDEWNKAVPLAAPKSSLDLAKLGKG
jgi:hypothetical protein